MSPVVKTLFVLLQGSKRKMLLMLCLFGLLSIIDLIGIGFLIPLFDKFFFAEPANYSLNNPILATILSIFDEASAGLLCLFVLIGFFLKSVTSLVVTWAISKFVNSERYHAGLKAVEHYLGSTYADFVQQGNASHVYHTQTLTSHLMAAVQSFLKLVSDVLVAVVLLIFLFVAQPIVFLFFTICFASMVWAINFLTRKKLVKLGETVNDAETKIITFSEDASRAFKEILILDAKNFFINRVEKELGRVVSAVIPLQVMMAAPRQIMEFTFLLFALSGFLLATWLNVSQKDIMLVATVYALVGLRLMPLATNISALLVRLNSLEASVLKIQELRNKMQDTLRPLSIYDRQGKNTRLKTTFEALEFVDVYFGYPEAAEPTLRDFNFKIRRSEVIGIKGYSGAGKTTFLNLMSGLLEVDAGQILLNGTPINGTNNLLGTVGYLPQDVSVISGTILENITFRSSCTKQDIEEIRKLGEISKLNDFVSLMPKGLMTELNQGALTISGGQRQKIAITRLLFHGRALLILDEATNAIDVEDEDKIIAQIKAQNNFGAMIIVTHRLSTLKHCDRVYNFKKGKLLETKKRF